jgi:hypothetical protein
MREKEAKMSPQTLREMLSYDPETGVVTWVNSRNKNVNGKPTGLKITDRWNKSYLRMQIRPHVFLVHRVAWAIHYGEWPKDQIDHRDGDGTNNRLDNLRSVSNMKNAHNTKLKSTNTSGHKGVRWHSIGKKWNARITVDGVEKSLGLFHRIEDAIAARKDAEKKYGFIDRGES